ncbi:hypothetical protein [uncultured Prevotella sp.]|uniref:hypothetical protein n=1 Tax=uncultured Prevotella sp. TaxID=159272 RepID=UPI0027DAB6D7|nr:hypothetical protein [uncultured Prevotella sp.]
MYVSQHSEFILTPLIRILKDSINACRAIGTGIDTYPIGEYLMQSSFLKMTGAQEQKMKCICWELATLDYDYRYVFLNNKKYGEYSSYKCKNGIFIDLVEIIRKKKPSFELSSLVDQSFCKNLFNEIDTLYGNSVLSIWQSREYLFYKENYSKVFDFNLLKYPSRANQLFQQVLIDKYETVVYRHRNRCAHNTLSYQVNKLDLCVLSGTDFGYHSYFFRFAILILIDEIFMKLFQKYQELYQNPQ